MKAACNGTSCSGILTPRQTASLTRQSWMIAH